MYSISVWNKNLNTYFGMICGSIQFNIYIYIYIWEKIVEKWTNQRVSTALAMIFRLYLEKIKDEISLQNPLSLFGLSAFPPFSLLSDLPKSTISLCLSLSLSIYIYIYIYILTLRNQIYNFSFLIFPYIKIISYFYN